MILVTGGAGFIGSHFVNKWPGEDIVVIDKMTYAADVRRITGRRVQILRENIRAVNALLAVLYSMKPRAVFHFAAETHVTKSIADPSVFFKNNVDGTLSLLHATLDYWKALVSTDKEAFRFVHISTDEVFGSLGAKDRPFTEESPYRPSTPYAASKGASDGLVRCFSVTYGLPVLIVNSTNNYGIGQHKEKLIPLVATAALTNKPITVHGDGLGTRDWIHVEDFCEALMTVFSRGKPGEAYCIGACDERRTIDVIHEICDLISPEKSALIIHVADRPGNDRRYAVDPAKVMALGWKPKRAFDLKPVIDAVRAKLMKVAA